MLKTKLNTFYYTVFLFIMSLSISSCITNKDLEYLRTSNKEENTFINNYEYRLRIGDLLSVQISTTTEMQHDFFNKEQTSNSQLMIQNPYLYGYLIKENGVLELPTLGEIKAEGFTLRELEKIIQHIASDFFDDPVIKINIINFEVSVLGAVNNPGEYNIVQPKPDLLYAISIAGDMTQFGNRKKVKIVRKENYISTIFYLDLTNSSVLNNTNFMLHPHDVIYVAPLKKRFYVFNNLPSVISMTLSAFTLFLLISNN